MKIHDYSSSPFSINCSDKHTLSIAINQTENNLINRKKKIQFEHGNEEDKPLFSSFLSGVADPDSEPGKRSARLRYRNTAEPSTMQEISVESAPHFAKSRMLRRRKELHRPDNSGQLMPVPQT